jgi:hypothetical protein
MGGPRYYTMRGARSYRRTLAACWGTIRRVLGPCMRYVAAGVRTPSPSRPPQRPPSPLGHRMNAPAGKWTECILSTPPPASGTRQHPMTTHYLSLLRAADGAPEWRSALDDPVGLWYTAK